MKWTAVTVDLSRVRKIGQSAGIRGKSFLLMTAGTLIFFSILGMASYVQSKVNNSPASSMKGLATSVSADFFADMMGMEIPHMQKEKSNFTFSRQNVLTFMFRLVTDINPKDPKTLLAREVPGLSGENAIMLNKGGTDDVGPPQDYTASSGGNKGQGQGKQTGISGPPAPSATASPSATPAPAASPTPTPGKTASPGQKLIMFYSTHDRESFMPEIGVADPSDAFDKKVNVTLLGKRMAARLEQQGIGAVDYDTDYPDVIGKSFNYYYSYKYSNKTVKDAMAANPGLKFMFDIHRDDGPRSKTTLTVKGTDYAQVFFIIGQKNPNWKQNEQFASQIQDTLEKKVPGISRGIWGKTAKEGDAEYNQSLSPHDLLIEIGGPYNTLEECNRTADVLADAIAEIYHDAVKAGAAADGNAAKQ